MSIYTPYFYIIQHKNSGMYYAGAKWGTNAAPNQLLREDRGYFTSSSIVNRIIHDEGVSSFVIRKVRIFSEAAQAIAYETRFLNRVNAARNPRFFNKHNNTLSTYGDDTYKQNMLTFYGVDHNMKSPDIQQKRKQTILERYGSFSSIHSSESIEKMRQTNTQRYGVSCTFALPGVLEKAAEAKRRKRLENPNKTSVRRQTEKSTQYTLSQQPKIDAILSSDIDFQKRGWVKKVSELIGIRSQQVKWWMQRNVLEFYNDNCIKRVVTHRPQRREDYLG